MLNEYGTDGLLRVVKEKEGSERERTSVYDHGIWFLYQSLHYRHKEMKICADTEILFVSTIIFFRGVLINLSRGESKCLREHESVKIF